MTRGDAERDRRVVVVGAGQAGARCAAALREGGWAGEIVILGEEDYPPYERPPLSKEILSGGDISKCFIMGLERYAGLGIELRLGATVVAIDRDRSTLHLCSGEEVAFDVLVLATGARARALAVPGATLIGVHSLRTIEDARQLASSLIPGASVGLIGGGFIGLEVAAKAIELGCRATVLDNAPTLLGRIFDGYLSTLLLPLHRERGVVVCSGVAVSAMLGDSHVEAVRLGSGEEIPVDIVVVGIGGTANDALAVAAGIDCADGILVDAEGRTSADGIYAIGDVARQRHGWNGPMSRLESWDNAELSAAATAAAILGKANPPATAPWFWTDQYGHNFQLIGGRREGDKMLVRGDPSAQSWSAYFHDGRCVHGAVLVNSGRERRWVKRLIDERAEVPFAALGDADHSMAALFSAAPERSRRAG